MSIESVTKFEQHYSQKEFESNELMRELNLLRDKLYSLKLIGQDNTRYGGFGYGNISGRLDSFNLPRNKRRFLITGTQTGLFPKLTNKHYTVVEEYYPDRNLVYVNGPIRASSESMTHGLVYDNDPKARFVLHVHSPDLWINASKLGIPLSREDVEYGEPEMAYEVSRLFNDTDIQQKKIFSMAGHEDGIISFGETSDEAGNILLFYLNMI